MTMTTITLQRFLDELAPYAKELQFEHHLIRSAEGHCPITLFTARRYGTTSLADSITDVLGPYGPVTFEGLPTVDDPSELVIEAADMAFPNPYARVVREALIAMMRGEPAPDNIEQRLQAVEDEVAALEEEERAE